MAPAAALRVAATTLLLLALATTAATGAMATPSSSSASSPSPSSSSAAAASPSSSTASGGAATPSSSSALPPPSRAPTTAPSAAPSAAPTASPTPCPMPYSGDLARLNAMWPTLAGSGTAFAPAAVRCGAPTGVVCDSCSVVSELRLGASALNGSLPTELGELSALRVLDVHANALSGTLPSELGRLAALRVLDVRDNALDGALPPQLGSSGVRVLRAYGNALSGAVPHELAAHLALNVLAVPGAESYCELQLARTNASAGGGNALACPTGAVSANVSTLARCVLRWCTPPPGTGSGGGAVPMDVVACGDGSETAGAACSAQPTHAPTAAPSPAPTPAPTIYVPTCAELGCAGGFGPAGSQKWCDCCFRNCFNLQHSCSVTLGFCAGRCQDTPRSGCMTPHPTPAPSTTPTRAPSFAPTPQPTDAPSTAPTSFPTGSPTLRPTSFPTSSPTAAPEPPSVWDTHQALIIGIVLPCCLLSAMVPVVIFIACWYRKRRRRKAWEAYWRARAFADDRGGGIDGDGDGGGDGAKRYSSGAEDDGGAWGSSTAAGAAGRKEELKAASRKEGYMHKGRNRRWFVLRDGLLSWFYAEESSSLEQIVGNLDMHGCQVLRAGAADVRINTPDNKSYTLTAPTGADRDAWFNAFEAAIQLLEATQKPFMAPLALGGGGGTAVERARRHGSGSAVASPRGGGGGGGDGDDDGDDGDGNSRSRRRKKIADKKAAADGTMMRRRVAVLKAGAQAGSSDLDTPRDPGEREDRARTMGRGAPGVGGIPEPPKQLRLPADTSMLPVGGPESAVALEPIREIDANASDEAEALTQALLDGLERQYGYDASKPKGMAIGSKESADAVCVTLGHPSVASAAIRVRAAGSGDKRAFFAAVARDKHQEGWIALLGPRMRSLEAEPPKPDSKLISFKLPFVATMYILLRTEVDDSGDASGSGSGSGKRSVLHWIGFRFRNRNAPAFAPEYLTVLDDTGMRRTLEGIYHMGVHINEHWLGMRWAAGRDEVLNFEEAMRGVLDDDEFAEARELLARLRKRVGNEDLNAVLEDDDELANNFTLFFTVSALSNAMARFDLTQARTPKASVLKELLSTNTPPLLGKLLKEFVSGPDYWGVSSLWCDDDA